MREFRESHPRLIHLLAALCLAAQMISCAQDNAAEKGEKQNNSNQCAQQNPSFGIINGRSTNEFPATVMLTISKSGSLGLCTGTFIGHNVLVTAAHCVRGAQNNSLKIHIGPQFNPQSAALSPSAIAVTQIFSAAPNLGSTPTREIVAVDVAVLMTAPNSAPAIANLATSPSPENTAYTITGYGVANDETSQGGGTKRVAQTTLLQNGFSPLSTIPGAIFTQQANSPGITQLGRVSQGDSGGPLYDNNGTLVGITSIGTRISSSQGEIFLSGFNSVISQAAKGVIQQARSAGAQVGVESQPQGTTTQPTLPNAGGSIPATNQPNLCI